MTRRSHLHAVILLGSLIISGKSWSASAPSDGRRRRILISSPYTLAAAAALTGSGILPLSSRADPSTDPLQNRPYAPTEALVPITRQRLLLEKAMDLANKLLVDGESGEKDASARGNVVAKLRSIMAPPSVVYSKNGLDLSLVRPFLNDDQIMSRTNLNELSGAALRASMNLYTSNLRFGESYVLTASTDAKKKYLRTYSRLPDVKQVITADLDLRDLYRNQAQTALEDVSAELAREDPDTSEVARLLQETSMAMDKWFSMIGEKDVQQALAMVESSI